MRLALVLLTACAIEHAPDHIHVPVQYTCEARLSCERTLVGIVLADERVCTASVEGAEDRTWEVCDDLALTKCDGYGWWQCEVTCRQVSDLPCLP